MDRVEIGTLGGVGIDPDKFGSAWVHGLPHNDKAHKLVGKDVKLNATLHRVETEHNPETNEKTDSYHFHIKGLHGQLGDKLKEKPDNSSRESELENAMKDKMV
jgi:FKBP-type peptidyl-prolyl cis-trans isomerase (trigger factor)